MLNSKKNQNKSKSKSALVSDVSVIMLTNHPTAWAQYFNATAKRADFVYGTDYSTNVTFMLTGGAGEDIQLHVQRSRLMLGLM
ncbi:MAG TPA: hypothetical protein C5S51_01985 [Methanosarcinaceae archaeon]|nr:hypothetical protein [Methanosarcinaceae archaeon]